MTTTIRTKTRHSTLKRAIQSIPQEMTQGGSEVQDLLTRCGLALLNHIRDAFLVKSAGGTDDAGDRWAPLKPTTVAYSRSGRTKTERNRNPRPSQALSARQQRQWWDLYRQGLAIYRGDKAAAAKRAWGILKRQGVRTILSKYGGRRVDILYNTGGLFNSITSQVTGSGEIVVSSSHPTAAVHHNGSPSRGIPQRRLWPEPRRWPREWWDDMVGVVRDGVESMVKGRVR